MNALQERLMKMRDWGENWDAEGAPSPDPKIMDDAIRLAALIDPTKAVVDLDAAGRPIFFSRALGLSGELRFDEDGFLAVYLRDEQ